MPPMATSKGVIQGYAAQAAVDSVHRIIVAAEVIGSGSEQAKRADEHDASERMRRAIDSRHKAEGSTASTSRPSRRCLRTSGTTRACVASRSGAGPR